MPQTCVLTPTSLVEALTKVDEAQSKGEEDKADRGRGGKTTSGNRQAWSSASPRGQWRTGENGKKTGCKIICGVPTTLAVKGLMIMMMRRSYHKGKTALFVFFFSLFLFS